MEHRLLIVSVLFDNGACFDTYSLPSLQACFYNYEGDAMTYCRIAIWFGSLFICITTILLSMIGIVGLENYVSPYLHEHNTVLMPHHQERNRNGFVLLFDWSSALLKSAIVLCVFWLIDHHDICLCLWQYTYFLAEVSASSSYTSINNDAPTDAPFWHQRLREGAAVQSWGEEIE
jgi:hypothetical protein